MFWSKLFRGFSVIAALAIATILPMGSAQAESVFTPYYQKIREEIPLGLSIRLPDKILSSTAQQQSLENFTVKVFASQNPSRLTLSLHGCQTGNRPCLLGSFVTENVNSSLAQAELTRHKSQGEQITLKQEVFGYILDSETPNAPTAFVTMMWQQDNMVHTLSFPQSERQNMLYMAVSMAQSESLLRP